MEPSNPVVGEPPGWHLKLSKERNGLSHHIYIVETVINHNWVISLGARTNKTTFRGADPAITINFPQMEECIASLHSSQWANQKTYMDDIIWRNLICLCYHVMVVCLCYWRDLICLCYRVMHVSMWEFVCDCDNECETKICHLWTVMCLVVYEFNSIKLSSIESMSCNL